MIRSSRVSPPRVRFSSTPVRWSVGGDVGRERISPWRIKRAGVVRPIFPPRDHATVKALACELVHETKQPLSRQSLAVVTERACLALEQPISRSTVARILNRDAIKPWRYKYWIFPRDPQFAEKAGRVLDLYAGSWQGQPLSPADEIISADEKTSIQARRRCHPALETGSRRPLRVENEYERGGALQYLAAWDVRRGRIMGRCEATTGIAPFGRLVAQVMGQGPYRSAPRVFCVVDNGSSHRGEASLRRWQQIYPNLILVHTPVHASWLNQVEIYFSILQRKVLTPNDFDSLDAVEQRIMLYEVLTNQHPRPFDWKFNRAQLTEFLARLEAKRNELAQK
jgi:DDE superfamily endonuclease